MSTVLVTGGGGFIGEALVQAFRAAGWSAVGCGPRKPAQWSDAWWRDYDLRWERLPPSLLSGIDVVVHGALLRDDGPANVRGGIRLFEASRDSGVTQFVFLSSLAAHDGAASGYGKQKLALQRYFEDRNALCVRPGFVLGCGGLFARMCDYLAHATVVPLFGGGRQPLQTVFIDDLTAAVLAGVRDGLGGTFTVAESEPVAYREFYRALCAALGTHATFVPVPFWIAEAALQVTNAFGIRLPIDRDNLLGLREMVADDGPRFHAPEHPVGTYAENIRLATVRKP